MFKRRYAVLGFLTWLVGKQLARRKARTTERRVRRRLHVGSR